MENSMAPDVTVVTPSYNQGTFIEETIRSVLCQEKVTIEYIVMDGGSADGTLEILEKYRNRLDYVSEPDHGQADAINKGFQRSRGRILAYLNSDDIYFPGAVAKAVHFLDRHREFAMAYGEGYHVDVHGRILERYYTESFDFQRLSEICFICQPTVFFRRELLSSIGYLDPRLHFCMDYDYWIRVAKRYSVGYIPEYLAASRLYPEGKTLSKRFEAHEEIVETVRRHYGHVPARWIAAYAHAFLERYLSRERRICKAAFGPLVETIYLMKYLAVNKRFPFGNSMVRLDPGNIIETKSPSGKEDRNPTPHEHRN
jgi:glycosyltransferase involved in cell wall biosynthesis